ncbi:hypothetical protein BESB_079520 [Besnoitia besnoiti]|uniref:DUF4211 domain-containing protein n=1 Tax=Besnoitia besnoiti TaxID=94643 RepID=A0A2A9MCS2_BESBE|nr:hypothetical protein BESB_079520 [Besnoitia besnoiti]PFH33736.1 hypothetical protein BESB_079520 [Besnoitia besnoiti]
MDCFSSSCIATSVSPALSSTGLALPHADSAPEENQLQAQGEGDSRPELVIESGRAAPTKEEKRAREAEAKLERGKAEEREKKETAQDFGAQTSCAFFFETAEKRISPCAQLLAGTDSLLAETTCAGEGKAGFSSDSPASEPDSFAPHPESEAFASPGVAWSHEARHRNDPNGGDVPLLRILVHAPQSLEASSFPSVDAKVISRVTQHLLKSKAPPSPALSQAPTASSSPSVPSSPLLPPSARLSPPLSSSASRPPPSRPLAPLPASSLHPSGLLFPSAASSAPVAGDVAPPSASLFAALPEARCVAEEPAVEGDGKVEGLCPLPPRDLGSPVEAESAQGTGVAVESSSPSLSAPSRRRKKDRQAREARQKKRKKSEKKNVLRCSARLLRGKRASWQKGTLWACLDDELEAALRASLEEALARGSYDPPASTGAWSPDAEPAREASPPQELPMEPMSSDSSSHSVEYLRERRPGGPRRLRGRAAPSPALENAADADLLQNSSQPSVAPPRDGDSACATPPLRTWKRRRGIVLVSPPPTPGLEDAAPREASVRRDDAAVREARTRSIFLSPTPSPAPARRTAAILSPCRRHGHARRFSRPLSAQAELEPSEGSTTQLGGREGAAETALRLLGDQGAGASVLQRGAARAGRGATVEREGERNSSGVSKISREEAAAAERGCRHAKASGGCGDATPGARQEDEAESEWKRRLSDRKNRLSALTTQVARKSLRARLASRGVDNPDEEELLKQQRKREEETSTGSESSGLVRRRRRPRPKPSCRSVGSTRSGSSCETAAASGGMGRNPSSRDFASSLFFASQFLAFSNDMRPGRRRRVLEKRSPPPETDDEGVSDFIVEDDEDDEDETEDDATEEGILADSDDEEELDTGQELARRASYERRRKRDSDKKLEENLNLDKAFERYVQFLVLSLFSPTLKFPFPRGPADRRAACIPRTRKAPHASYVSLVSVVGESLDIFSPPTAAVFCLAGFLNLHQLAGAYKAEEMKSLREASLRVRAAVKKIEGLTPVMRATMETTSFPAWLKCVLKEYPLCSVRAIDRRIDEIPRSLRCVVCGRSQGTRYCVSLGGSPCDTDLLYQGELAEWLVANDLEWLGRNAFPTAEGALQIFSVFHAIRSQIWPPAVLSSFFFASRRRHRPKPGEEESPCSSCYDFPVGKHCGEQILAWHKIHHFKPRLLKFMHTVIKGFSPCVLEYPEKVSEIFDEVSDAFTRGEGAESLERRVSPLCTHQPGTPACEGEE